MRPGRAFALTALLVLGPIACSRTYKVGDKVLVQWEESSPEVYPALVLSVDSPGKYRIHYDGYDPIWDESVLATRIKGTVHGSPKRPPPPAKVRARLPSAGAAPQSMYKVGDRVKVDWKGSFYPATILAVLGGERYRVHYDGYDSNWDEDVEFSRIQRK